MRQDHSVQVRDSWVGSRPPRDRVSGLWSELCVLPRRSPPGATVTRRKIRCPSLLRARRGRELLFARLLEQTVQVDLRGLLGEVDALHPGVVEDVFEGRPVRGAQGQAPPDEVLALCGGEKPPRGEVSSCPPPLSYAQTQHHFWGVKKDGTTRATKSHRPPGGATSHRAPRSRCPPGETLCLKYTWPCRISSSCSKGMSPHTMS